MPTPTETSHMPSIPGYYYDPNTNRYYKGNRPPPPPKPPKSTCITTLPSLLRATAIGHQTTPASLHASLLHNAKSSELDPIFTQNDPIAPILQHNATTSFDAFAHMPVGSSNAIIPSETFAHMPVGSSNIFVLAFPKVQLDRIHYASEYQPISLASYGYALAYATNDGVYVYMRMRDTTVYRRYAVRMNTVSLSARHILMAGGDVRVQKLSDCLIPPRPVRTIKVGGVTASDIIDPNNFAVGTLAGRVVLADKTGFQPSGARRSVTALKIKGNLIWCSTMCGEPGITAWDVRCLSGPAIVCKGQSNVHKRVGLDVSDTIVIAASDDQHVRVWDVRGGEVLSKISVPGVVKRLKMAGWTNRAKGTCGVWFDVGNQVFTRVVST